MDRGRRCRPHNRAVGFLWLMYDSIALAVFDSWRGVYSQTSTNDYIYYGILGMVKTRYRRAIVTGVLIIAFISVFSIYYVVFVPPIYTESTLSGNLNSVSIVVSELLSEVVTTTQTTRRPTYTRSRAL